ncbi:MAG: ZIP family metal transporter, partial [Planctomycetota bacterium]|nr:ZIP family metal transporter [Planctomycetota bacterium]
TWAATASGAALAALTPRPGPRTLGVLLAIAAGLMGWAALFGLAWPAWDLARAEAPFWVALFGLALAAAAGIWLARAIRARIDLDHRPALGRQLFWAMTLHHIPEGMALGLGVVAGAQGDATAATGAGMLVVAMAVHNAAEGALVAAPLRHEGASRWQAFWRGQLSGVAEIGGAIVGASAATFSAAVLPWALMAAAGCMLAVIVGDLWPELRQLQRASQAMTGRSVCTEPSASTRCEKQERRRWWQAGPGASTR